MNKVIPVQDQQYSDLLIFEVDLETWEEFNRLLDEPPTPIPQLVDLLAQPTIFDE